jgi:hypothetical protein
MGQTIDGVRRKMPGFTTFRYEQVDAEIQTFNQL